MRHKYQTRAIVLTRSALGEANLLLALITSDVGLVYARAQGARKRGAKLAPALATFAESDVALVRGAEGWRVAGASLECNWFCQIPRASRDRATRVTGLLLRLVRGEASERELFGALEEFLRTLAETPEAEHDAAEIVAALRLLSALGLDAGDIPHRAAVAGSRGDYVRRVNRGIEASGL